MDTPQTKAARVAAHKALDSLWITKYQRKQAYAWLATQMSLAEDICHIGFFTIAQCQEVVRLVQKHKPVIEDRQEPDRRFDRKR